MTRVLLAWIGQTDLDAPLQSARIGNGPIACALQAKIADEAVLLNNYPREQVEHYVRWLQEFSPVPFSVSQYALSSPTHFGEIHEAAVHACEQVMNRHKRDCTLVFHLSPGTSRMVAIWIILAKTRFPADLIESSQKYGVSPVEVPFDISAEFIPDAGRVQSRELSLNLAALPPKNAEFDRIIYRSPEMARVVDKARRVAAWNDINVLIEGETGTGKELFARAIHSASSRKVHREDAFCINCGAIPSELVESELFGHEKGAFTGATDRKIGAFEAADGGTILLDEIGEMPLQAQVKLLRILQEGKFTRIGSTKPIDVNVRIIAATNKTLTEEIAAGRFREDLFFRLVGIVLKLPPLRQRHGDLSLLLDHFLEETNKKQHDMPGYVSKKLSARARNVFLDYHWPGNVRELSNTIQRAALWSVGPTITEEDANEALVILRVQDADRILGRPMAEGVNLPGILKTVAQHYLTRALEESGGNKTRAARLVGLPTYQTFSYWINKYR